jgi:hypothetical protein
MGDFVYGEAQYNHDQRHFHYEHEGPHWRQVAGIPPMLYPTHSTSMILGCLPHVYATKVCGFGYREKYLTDIFGENGVNLWNNPFSNTAMLCQLSNGGVARISENRRLAFAGPNSYISQFYGSEGCYEFAVSHHYFSHWSKEDRKKLIMEEVTKELLPESVTAVLNEPDTPQRISDGMGFWESSPRQHTERIQTASLGDTCRKHLIETLLGTAEVHALKMLTADIVNKGGNVLAVHCKQDFQPCTLYFFDRAVLRGNTAYLNVFLLPLGIVDDPCILGAEDFHARMGIVPQDLPRHFLCRIRQRMPEQQRIHLVIIDARTVEYDHGRFQVQHFGEALRRLYRAPGRDREQSAGSFKVPHGCKIAFQRYFRLWQERSVEVGDDANFTGVFKHGHFSF